MAGINNLTQGNVDEIYRRLRKLETGTPNNSTAIGRGGMEIYDGGMLTISNGGLSVTGTAAISGTLNADGTVNLTGIIGISGPLTVTGATALNGPTNVGGNTTITGTLTTNGPLDVNGTTTLDGNTTATGTFTTNGPLHVNGATDINGNLDVDGTLDINGAATLNNDLTVQGGGKIKAGLTQLSPDGTVSFGGGSRITPDNGFGAFALESGAASIQLTPDNADYHVQFSGGGYFQGLVRGMGLKLSSLPTTTEPANLHIDATGNVKRSTAA